MKYENRNGKAYYLHEGKTKTGKPRYFFSAKDSSDKGTLVDAIPEGYEVYEKPENAQVFLRKKRPRLITELEEQFVKKHLAGMQSGQYLVDCKDGYLTIYESDRGSMQSIQGVEGSMGNFEDQLRNILDKMKIDLLHEASLTDKIIPKALHQGNYTAVMRFCLRDKETRTFTAERYNFRGAIDDWIYIDGPDRFQSLVTKYIKHLGTEQFYELPYL